MTEKVGFSSLDAYLKSENKALMPKKESLHMKKAR